MKSFFSLIIAFGLLFICGCADSGVVDNPESPQVSDLTELDTASGRESAGADSETIELSDPVVKFIVSNAFLSHQNRLDFQNEYPDSSLAHSSIEVYLQTAENLYTFMEEKDIVISKEFLSEIEHFFIWDLSDCSTAVIYTGDENHSVTLPFEASVSCLDDFVHMPNVMSINMPCTTIQSLEPLCQTPKLTQLALASSKVESIEPLRNLLNIETLIIESEYLNDFSPLEALPSLNYLVLRNMKIRPEDLSFLSNAKDLRTLVLSGNGLESLPGAAYIARIKSLDISGNNIGDIAFLRELPYLTDLNISGNGITDLTPLAELKNLQHIDISDNYIEDISPLFELENLESLTLSEDTAFEEELIFFENVEIRYAQ